MFGHQLVDAELLNRLKDFFDQSTPGWFYYRFRDPDEVLDAGPKPEEPPYLGKGRMFLQNIVLIRQQPKFRLSRHAFLRHLYSVRAEFLQG